MRVLYVHSAGPFGGSSRSLYEMVKGMEFDEVNKISFFFLTQRGTSNRYFAQVGQVFKVRGLPQFDHGRNGYYRGARWLVLAREIFYIPYLIYGSLKVKRAIKNVDIVHVNDFVGIFSGLFLRWIFAAKLVVHVRCLVNTDNSLVRTRIINGLLERMPSKVVCIDGNVRRTISPLVDAEIIHNGLNIKRTNSQQSMNCEDAVTPLKVGFVGNILLQKGIMELLQAGVICKRQGVPIEFHVYGDSAKAISGVTGEVLKFLGLRQDVKAEAFKFIDENNLSENFHFHGFVDDLSKVYENIDVVCFPSHLDAPGRPVIEAAYYGRPSIVAVENPSPDTLIPGVTGIAIPAKSPANLADAIINLALNREWLSKMGEGAKKLSEEFYNQKNNSRLMHDIYRRIIETDE